MTATYSILEPSPKISFSRRRRRSARSRMLLALTSLVIGVPLALMTANYLLNDNPISGDDPAVTALQLPPLPQIDTPDVAFDGALASAPDMSLPAPATPPDDPSRRVIRLTWGDTLVGLLAKAAVPSAEAHEAMSALRKVYDPRDLRAGEEVVLRYNDDGSFGGFEFEPAADRTVRVERHQSGDFKASSVVRPVSSNVVAALINIEGSLYESGIKAGIPAGTMSALVKALSYEVDFQRDIHPGNSFKVMYEVFRNPEGVLVRTGDILYAEVKLNNRSVPVYRYRFTDGRTAYYDRKGQSVRKALMRTPVNAARISSGFGMRRHPILGYSKMHKGMDFAAPTGTPIYAAGDGIIVDRGWKNGYGNYIRIKHNGSLATAYAHMSRFASGFNRGSRVRQGQIIGYVGSTGRSTGPHLHFEVMVNGTQVNPLKVANMNTGEALSGAHRDRLKAIVQAVDKQFETLTPGQAVDVAFSSLTGMAIPAPKTAAP